MELIVLAVPDCPNVEAMLQRLEQAAPDDAARVDVRLITDQVQAARHGMHGSPTLLINGTDPFAAPNATASVSCRIYRDADGRAVGAPSIEQLREVLQQPHQAEH